MRSPLDDPSFNTASCATCGLPLQTTSHNVYFDKLGAPVHGTSVGPHSWWPTKPTTLDHELAYENVQANPSLLSNHEHTPSDNRTHEQDYDRISRSLDREHMEKGYKLSRQFDEFMP